ncbi:hypothetical protein GCM10009853_072510 [Glycomyces scopariae]
MTVTRTDLFDQELVVHLFAPVDGPNAGSAYEEIANIWSRCRDRLGMSNPIPHTGLSAHLPAGFREFPVEGAVAGIEDGSADFQAIARRDHDMVNLSIAFSAPLESHARRRRIGSALPPGWFEFDRWWREVSSHGTDAQLGVVTVFQAQSEGDTAGLAAEVRKTLPRQEEKPRWWEEVWTNPQRFPIWEISPGDDRPGRCFAAVVPQHRSSALSAWTWSRGDTALPPLARYLMHAAKLRHQARVRGDGNSTAELIRRAEGRRERLSGSIGTPTNASITREDWDGLHADNLALTGALADMRAMRNTVKIAIDRMTTTMPELCGADLRLVQRLPKQLADDVEYLDTARDAANDIATAWRDHRRSPGQEAPAIVHALPHDDDGPSAAPRQRARRTLVRMGFAVDIVEYSLRTAPAKDAAQERLKQLVLEVLDELDLDIRDTEHQGTGDGMNVFLPASVELHRTLPRLVRSWDEKLARNNDQYVDRLRLRLSLAIGPVGVAAIGLSGSTIVEVTRLVESEPIRRAIIENPRADLAVLVSDQLYEYVVGEGHPGLEAYRFERVEARVKSYNRTAWLWVSELGGST